MSGDVFDKEKAREEYLAGTLSKADATNLRLNTSTYDWLRLEKIKYHDANAKKQAALIEECTAPLLCTESSDVLQMRTIKLLAAILEKLP